MKIIYFACLALLLTSSPSAAQFSSGMGSGFSGGAASTPVPNFTANGGLPKWRTCRAQVKAGTGNCAIVIAGDSQSTGHGSFNADTANDAHSGAWANQLATIFSGIAAIGVPTETNSVVGTASIGAASFAAFDTRTAITTWTPTSGFFVLGGNGWQNADATNCFSFKPTDTASYPSATAIQTDTIDVYTAVTSPGGTTVGVALSCGGTPICTIAYSSVGFNKTTCSAALGNNTYFLKCSNVTAGTCNFLTLHAYNSTVNRVAILNGAADGATTGNFINSTGNPFDPVPSLSVYQPNLCIYMLMGNDAVAQTPLVTFQSNITTFINGCKAQNADVLLLTSFPFGLDSSPITIDQYRQAVLSVATSSNVAVWDVMSYYGATSSGTMVGAWAQKIPSGWNEGCCGSANNTTHYGVANNAFFSGKLSEILLQ